MPQILDVTHVWTDTSPEEELVNLQESLCLLQDFTELQLSGLVRRLVRHKMNSKTAVSLVVPPKHKKGLFGDTFLDRELFR